MNQICCLVGKKCHAKLLNRLVVVRLLTILMITVVVVILSSNGMVRGDEHSESREWKVGYWFWGMGNESYRLPDDAPPVDMLYVHVGTLSLRRSTDTNPELSAFWPERLPEATGLFLVWRFEGNGPLQTGHIPELIKRYQALKSRALRTGQKVVGVQLDYDCPTSRLGEYNTFLQALREALPKDDLISITALLDWFRGGTKIDAVLHWVDEYVPQFYDVNASRSSSNQPSMEIGKPIDTTHWAAVFNAHKRPYRIAIASFGRIIGISKDTSSQSGSQSAKPVYISNGNPLEVIRQARLTAPVEITSPAGESIVRYSPGPVRSPGSYDVPALVSTIEMVFPSEKSVSSSYLAAKAMGKWCTGVVFFRWPSANEAMALKPEEIQDVLAGKGLSLAAAQLEVEDGFCAATFCNDLSLHPKDRFSKVPVSYNIRCSQEMDYFLPQKLVPVTITGPSNLRVDLPAYPGVPKIPLGRVVTREAATCTLEEKPL